MFPERSSLSRVVQRHGERFAGIEAFVSVAFVPARVLRSFGCCLSTRTFTDNTITRLLRRQSFPRGPINPFASGRSAEGRESGAKAPGRARNGEEIAPAFIPRIRWLVKLLERLPVASSSLCFRIKYLLFVLPYASLRHSPVSLSRFLFCILLKRMNRCSRDLAFKALPSSRVARRDAGFTALLENPCTKEDAGANRLHNQPCFSKNTVEGFDAPQWIGINPRLHPRGRLVA